MRRVLGPLAMLWVGISGCAAAEPLARYEFVEPHMGTLFRIVLFAPTSAAAAEGAEAAFGRVAALDRTFSDYAADSEVRRLMRRPAGTAVPVSADLSAVLGRAQTLAAASGGAFDVTIGPVVRLWRESRRTGLLPTEEKRRRALVSIGYRHITLDPVRRTVVLHRGGLQLDFGGIAKGAAADAALAELRRRGLGRALVAAGGDLAVGEPPPGAEGWRVEVEHLGTTAAGWPRDRLWANRGISTSGDAAQFVEIGGVRYAHIVDPRTGLGVTERRQVTVVAATATDSDGLATAVYLLGRKRGSALVAAHPGAELWIEEGVR